MDDDSLRFAILAASARSPIVMTSSGGHYSRGFRARLTTGDSGLTGDVLRLIHGGNNLNGTNRPTADASAVSSGCLLTNPV